MKNIDPSNSFEATINNSYSGIVTTLTTGIEVSVKDCITHNRQTLITTDVYKGDGLYDLVYTVVNTNGEHQSFKEDDGILPTLFLSPANETYVSVIPYHPDKEQQINIPVFNREKTEHPKGTRPFIGDFIGVSNEYSVFYYVDPFTKTKPDKMLAIEFNKAIIKKNHNIKIAPPSNNRICISDNQIHLLGKENDQWVHRQIDEKGNEIRRRNVNLDRVYFRQALSLCFDNPSYLIDEGDDQLVIIRIDEAGNSTEIPLIGFSDPLFNTWQPVKIAEGTYLTRFNTEFGNGWIITKNDTLIECFYGKATDGYKNLINDEIIQISDRPLVVSGANKTSDNSYAILFYPMPSKDVKNKEMMILNRKLR